VLAEKQRRPTERFDFEFSLGAATGGWSSKVVAVDGRYGLRLNVTPPSAMLSLGLRTLLTVVFLSPDGSLGWAADVEAGAAAGAAAYDLSEERIRDVLARVEAAEEAEAERRARFPRLSGEQRQFGVNPAYEGFFAEEYKPEEEAADRAAGERTWIA